MERMVFTFGGGQTHPVTGENLGKRYVVVEAESTEHCRAVMLNRFGREWAFSYPSEEAAGVDRFGLVELPADEWPADSGEWAVATHYQLVPRHG